MRPRQPQRILAARRRQTPFSCNSLSAPPIDRSLPPPAATDVEVAARRCLTETEQPRTGGWMTNRHGMSGTLLDGTAPSQKAPGSKSHPKLIGRVVALDLTRSTGSVAGSRLGRGDDITQPYKPSQRG